MGKYRVNIKYNTERDMLIIERLEKQENKQDYIRRLILSDIAADQLSGLFKIEDRAHNDEFRRKCEYWEEHCKAIEDRDNEDVCKDCYYSIDGTCTLDDIEYGGLENA